MDREYLIDYLHKNVFFFSFSILRNAKAGEQRTRWHNDWKIENPDATKERKKVKEQWFSLASNGQTMNNSILFIPTQAKSKHHH